MTETNSFFGGKIKMTVTKKEETIPGYTLEKLYNKLEELFKLEEDGEKKVVVRLPGGQYKTISDIDFDKDDNLFVINLYKESYI